MNQSGRTPNSNEDDTVKASNDALERAMTDHQVDGPGRIIRLPEAMVIHESTAKVIQEIAKERTEQIEKHGFDAACDDDHDEHDLAQCAGAVLDIATSDSARSADREFGVLYQHWPIETSYKILGAIIDKTERDQLIVAAALIVAEIERMDRL